MNLPLRASWFFNPLAATEVRALLRGRKWVYMVLIFGVLGAAAVGLVLATGSTSLYLSSLPGLLFFYAELVSPIATAARVQSRRAQRTLDELLTTRFTAPQILGGLITPTWLYVAPALLVGGVCYALGPYSEWDASLKGGPPWHVHVVNAVSILGTVLAWSLLGAAIGARCKSLADSVTRLLLIIVVAKVLFTSVWMFVAGMGLDAGGGPTPWDTVGWNVERLFQERSAGLAFGLGWYMLLWAQWSVAWGFDQPGALLWTALVIAFGAWQFRRAARHLTRQAR